LAAQAAGNDLSHAPLQGIATIDAAPPTLWCTGARYYFQTSIIEVARESEECCYFSGACFLT
jgi:hypothetical protein